MKTLLTLLAALFVTTSVNAQALPPVPEGGLITVQHGYCTDNVTERDGYCVIQVDMENNTYVTLILDDVIQTVRKVVGDSYVTIYQRSKHDL